MKPVSAEKPEETEYQTLRALSLHRAKRAQTGEIFIEGTNCIKQAADARLPFTRFVRPRGRALSSWARNLIAAHPEALALELAPDLFASLTGRANTPELLATAKLRPPALADLRLPPRPFILVFDRPADPGNLGSALRSANAFGADAALVLGPGADPWEPKAVRASLGGIFHTQAAVLESTETLAAFIRAEKAKNGLLVLGADSAGTAPLAGTPLQRPVMVIAGNETKGMSPALRALCDEVIRIPLAGTAGSLNAACAVSIIRWEVYRGSAGAPAPGREA
jgi:TrmH family RNA methyltransferase